MDSSRIAVARSQVIVGIAGWIGCFVDAKSLIVVVAACIARGLVTINMHVAVFFALGRFSGVDQICASRWFVFARG